MDGENDVLGDPLKELLDGRSPLVDTEILATIPDRILGEELIPFSGLYLSSQTAA